MTRSDKGSNGPVQLSTVMKIVGAALAISLGATGYIAAEFQGHAEGTGHLETAESLATLKQSTGEIQRRLTDIEVKQEQTQDQVQAGFEDLKRAIEGNPHH